MLDGDWSSDVCSSDLSQNGILQTVNGLSLVGDAGPLALPPDQDVMIAKDGTVSTVPIGQDLASVAIAGRIKRVNPPERDLVRGEDGLFRLAGGRAAQAETGVELISGALESSNVNPAEVLVNMVSLARQFEMQMKVLSSAQENHRSADKMLSLTA
jgi:flagellar basal-body rod protein FlgF